MKKIVLVALMCCTHVLFAQNIIDEGFEDGNIFENPPVGWICQADGWLSGQGVQSHSREPRTGDWYAYLGWNKDRWMFKEINLEAGETYNFSLWYKTDGIAGFSFEIKWGNDTLPTTMTEDIFPLTAVSNTTYSEVNATLSPTTSGTYYIGIHGVSNNSPWYLCVDDILLQQVNDYGFQLNRLNEDTIAKSGSYYNYYYEIENIGLNADDIDLSATSAWPVDFYEKDGATPITSLSLLSSEIDTIILRQSVPATGVTFGQTESTIVEFNSSNSTFSINDTVYTTAITPVSTFPFLENFDGETFPALGWNAQIIQGTKNLERSTLGEYPTCIPLDNSAGMAYYNSFSAQVGYSALLVSPELELTNAEYVVRLWIYRTDDIDTKADKFEIYLSDDENLSSAQLLGEVHRTISMSPVETTNGWFEYAYVFNGENTNKFIVVKAVSDYGWNMYIDNVKVALNLPDTEAPEFVSINNLTQYADLDMPVSIVIRDESAVKDTMTGIYNVGDGNQNFELILNTDGDFNYTGNIPAQTDLTTGTVKFIMEDVNGNTAETQEFEINWEGVAPLLEESFEGEFPPAGWERISEPFTWFIWWQESTVLYEDSDGVEYTVVPPDGEKQASVGWDYQLNSQDEWLISPPVHITDNANLTFETFAQLGSYDYDNFIVAISVNAGAWQEIWNAFNLDNEVIQYDQTLAFPLEEYVGQTIRVAWRAYNAMYDNLWYSWFIDDVRIEKIIGNKEITKESNEFNFKVYPNPASNEIMINADNQEFWKVEISDASGRNVSTGVNEILGSKTIDISNLPKGIYFITISNSKNSITKRIVKI